MLGLGFRTAQELARAPEHLRAMLSEVHDLVRRASRLLDRADLIAVRMEHKLDELDAITAESQTLVLDGREVADTATGIAVAARGTRDLAQEQVLRLRRVLDLYQPLLESLAPLGAEAAAALRPAHLRGLVTLLDELPHLVDRLEPALDGMGSMVPEMREVTDRMDNVGQVVEGLPGAKLLRRRGRAREEHGAPDR
jgi:hypothetical protein